MESEGLNAKALNEALMKEDEVFTYMYESSYSLLCLYQKSGPKRSFLTKN